MIGYVELIYLLDPAICLRLSQGWLVIVRHYFEIVNFRLAQLFVMYYMPYITQQTLAILVHTSMDSNINGYFK